LIKRKKVNDLGFILTVVGAHESVLVQVDTVRILPALMLNQVLLASVPALEF
jgi:hypothetical protein